MMITYLCRMRSIWSAIFSGILLAQAGYEKNIDLAFTQAKKQKKPLWIMVSASWCGPCKVVEQKVLPNETFQAAVRRDFIPVKVIAASDAENTPKGDSIAKVYAVNAFPTFLCVEPTGEAFYRHEGVDPEAFLGTDEMAVKVFLTHLENAQKARKELPDMRRRFQKGDRSVEFLRAYLAKLITLGQKSEGDKVFDAYLKAAGSARIAWLGEPGYAQHLITLSQWGKKYRDYIFQIADTLRMATDAFLYEQIYRPILNIDFLQKLSEVQSDWDRSVELAEKYVKEWQEKFPFVESMVYSVMWRGGLRSANATTREKASSLALQATALSFPLEIPDTEGRETLAEQYNSLAWTFYEQVEDSDKLWVAVLLTKVALAYKPQAWHIWDTLGALYYKLKRKREALEALDKAISLAKAQGETEDGPLAETIRLRQRAAELSD